MKTGQILVADHNGVYVIKMMGDVRLTLCISFDQFIDAMFKSENFTSVLFDLSDAEAIDSTTLGLMAKISILGQERRGVIPVILASNPSIQPYYKLWVLVIFSQLSINSMRLCWQRNR
jgi:anti-anti-sigma regulatory factor